MEEKRINAARMEEKRMNAEELVESRIETSGDWAKFAVASSDLERWVVKHQQRDLTDSQKAALNGIAIKLSRIVVGDPNFLDHWDDIAGYATLAAKEIQRRPPTALGRCLEEELNKIRSGGFRHAD